MKNEQEEQLTAEEIERFELARHLSKEVVDELNLKELDDSPIEENDLYTKNFYYKITKWGGVEIYAQMITEYDYVSIRFSLVNFAYDLIGLIRLLLSDETAPKVLKSSVIEELRKRNINILKLFDIEKEDVEDVIKYNTKEILKIFARNTHLFTRCSIIDAFGHAKVGYLQNIIRPMFREHWAKLGLPKNFSVLTDDELDSLRRYYTDRRRWFLGDKRQMLDWRKKELVEEYELLMNHYRGVKTQYKQLKTNYQSLYRRKTIDDWNNEWKEVHSPEYQHLNQKALSLIEDFRPFELAQIHLADHYGVDVETIRKRIQESKRQNTSK